MNQITTNVASPQNQRFDDLLRELQRGVDKQIQSEQFSEQTRAELQEIAVMLLRMRDWLSRIPLTRLEETLHALIQRLHRITGSHAPQWLREPVLALGPEHSVSGDRMSLLVLIPTSFSSFWDEAALIDALKRIGIEPEFISRELVSQIFSQKNFNRWAPVARGQSPSLGEDGEIEDCLNLLQKNSNFAETPTTRFKTVSKNQVLFRKKPPTPGASGKDVFGAEVHGMPGIEKKFPPVRNGALSEDGLAILSKVDGCVFAKQGVVRAATAQIIDGDASGPIKSSNTLYVKGRIRTGSEISVNSDVVCEKNIESDSVNAAGSIYCSGDIKGQDTGRVSAGGDIECASINTAVVRSKRDIFAKSQILNSKVMARRVNCHGSNASIIGGRIDAVDDVHANVLGDDLGVKTEIVLGAEDARLETDRARYAQHLAQKKDERTKTRASMKDQTSDKSAEYARLIENDRRLTKEILRLERALKEIDKAMAYSREAFRMVRVSGTIYPGVIIQIQNAEMKVRNKMGPTTVQYSNGKLIALPYQEREENGEEAAAR